MPRLVGMRNHPSCDNDMHDHEYIFTHCPPPESKQCVLGGRTKPHVRFLVLFQNTHLSFSPYGAHNRYAHATEVAARKLLEEKFAKEERERERRAENERRGREKEENNRIAQVIREREVNVVRQLH